jgi:hypothetical protein
MVKEAEAFVHKWCQKPKEVAKKSDELKDQPPVEWQDAYLLKPWVDFPDRPSNA